jgi:hypothetical protein
MSREPRRYQDNLIEAITFEDDSQGDPDAPDAPEPSDLLMVQIDADPESNRGVPRVNLTPTQGQDDAQSLIDPVVIPYPTPAPAVAAVPAAAAAGEGGGGNAPQQKQGDDTPAAAFVDALPFPGRLPGLRQRAALVEGVGAAFAAGWAEGALRRQLTSETGGAHSLVGLYLHRLEPGNLPAPRAAGPADRGGTPVPPRWAEQQARVAVLAGRECGGDGGMCGRPVPAGEVWCLVCAPAAV